MLKNWKELKRIKTNIQMLRGMQEQNIQDDYSCGLYNGIELCMAVVENREPVFATHDKEPISVEHNERAERTVASGIIRKGSV